MAIQLTEIAAALKRTYYAGPNPKSITPEKKVLTIMTHVRNEAITTAKGIIVAHKVYKCPRGVEGCTLPEAEISFQVGKGYTNPHNHLVRCLCGGIEEDLEDYYWNARANAKNETHVAGKQSTLSFAFQGFSTKKEMDMFAYIKLIVEQQVPLSCVECPAYRYFAKDRSHFSIKYVRNVILAMTLSIEEKLQEELAKKAGKLSIVHDAWSKFGEHYSRSGYHLNKLSV